MRELDETGLRGRSLTIFTVSRFLAELRRAKSPYCCSSDRKLPVLLRSVCASAVICGRSAASLAECLHEARIAPADLLRNEV